MQNAEGDDGYAFIGGHAAFGETTDEPLVREFKEEIGADIKIKRLLRHLTIWATSELG
jgi:8-oxo-dGTP pyrophosphatase MutT (NUDIX family)